MGAGLDDLVVVELDRRFRRCLEGKNDIGDMSDPF